MKLSLRIAARYLRARKSHSAVGVIAAVSIAGIAVATAAIVCVLSVFNGFSRLASDRLSVFDPALKIEPTAGKIIAGADSLAEVITRDIGGVISAHPVVEEKALAVYDGRQTVVNLKGVTPTYGNAHDIGSAIIDGEFITQPDSAYAYATIAVGTAIRLQASPGYYDWLNIYVPRRVGRINPAAPMSAFRGDSLIVSGVFQLDQAEYDADMIIVPIERARRLLDYTDEATAIEIELAPSADARTVARQITGLWPGLTAKTRLQQQASTFKMIEVEKWITTLLLVFILLIASFNIISTLSMLIIEKRHDISTFTALGARRSLLRGIFMNESMMLTLSGGAIGMVAGVVLVLAQQYGGFIHLGGDPSQLSVTVYPVELHIADLAVVAGALIITGILVSLVTRLMVDSSHS